MELDGAGSRRTSEERGEKMVVVIIKNCAGLNLFDLIEDRIWDQFGLFWFCQKEKSSIFLLIRPAAAPETIFQLPTKSAGEISFSSK